MSDLDFACLRIVKRGGLEVAETSGASGGGGPPGSTMSHRNVHKSDELSTAEKLSRSFERCWFNGHSVGWRPVAIKRLLAMLFGS
ncbi:hypothetical protein ACKS0A_03252 [Histoplasma ohiense]